MGKTHETEKELPLTILTIIDEKAGEIMGQLLPSLPDDTDEHDQLYGEVHSILKNVFRQTVIAVVNEKENHSLTIGVDNGDETVVSIGIADDQNEIIEQKKVITVFLEHGGCTRSVMEIKEGGEVVEHY